MKKQKKKKLLNNSKLCGNNLCYNKGKYRVISNIPKCYCTNKYNDEYNEKKYKNKEEKKWIF